ncbi:Na+/H+ antiporter family protein [Endozoicomonadaceae bacterium StTr2]
MNAVVVAVIVMLGLSLCRINVIIALIVAALVGGITGGLGIQATIAAFENGAFGGGKVALNYAMLGALAVAIARSGLPGVITRRLVGMVNTNRASGSGSTMLKWWLVGGILLMSCLSQNLIPIHIAFIPVLIPPLLSVMAELGLDRRLVACTITFGIVAAYMLVPIGFGGIFLNDVLAVQLWRNGLDISDISLPQAMLLPTVGMVAGLMIAVCFSYRGKRHYEIDKIHAVEQDDLTSAASTKAIWIAITAIVLAFVIQLGTGSLVMGALAGFLLFMLGGVIKPRESDSVFNQGMAMMAMVGFIMITASGFSEVLKQTGHITSLVETSVSLMGGNQALAALVMLLVGLLVTMGIGSAFSTVPILSAIYVPLATAMDFSTMAIVALVGTAGVLGDAGSPASDSTLGPTVGLNVDGQHNHIWDSVVPSFLHYNLPLIAFGWLAAMVL